MQVLSFSEKSTQNQSFSEAYSISHQIGKGAFGKLYKVSHRQDPTHPFAAKVVRLPGSATEKTTDLEREAQILQSLVLDPGFPRVQNYSTESNHEILVMSLLGPNLGYLHKQCEGRFSLKTVILLALQALRRIEALHKQGMLHRDIKPENLVMGGGCKDETTLYLIDFGLAVPYLDGTGKHVPFSKNGNVAGTLYYLSVFGHLGIQAARRDDLISLGYVLIHLIKGGLPWVHFPGNMHEKIKKIFQMKSTMSHEKLCEGLPGEFVEYFKYTTSLPFFQKPNYEYLEGLFRRMLEDAKEREDGGFDWMRLESKGIDLQGRKIMNEGLNIYMKNAEDSETIVDFELL